MAYTAWQRFITDGETVVPLATITVRKESDGSLATIYSDDAGSAKTNPFTATAAGLAKFYAAAGTYKITAESGSFSAEFRDVAIGEAQGYDVGADGASKLLTRDQLDARFAPYARTERTVTGTSATADSDDAWGIIRTTNSSAVTVTLDMASGEFVQIIRGGTGAVTIQTQTGDTIEAVDDIVTINKQYGGFVIWKRSATVYMIVSRIEPSISDGSSTGDVLTWDGDSWEPGYGLADLGFVNVVDDVYTAGSPKAVTATTRTQLDISYGASSLDTYAPRNVAGSGTGGWWDDTNYKFDPSNVGDSYIIRLSCFVHVATGTNPYIDFEFSIDEGASPPDVILARSVGLNKGAGVDTLVSITNSVFSLNTFVANGLKIFATPSHNCDIWNMSVLITKVGDGRA